MTGVYPGGLQEWGLLWSQNVVLIFIQFTTAATMYTQDTRYSRLVLRPLERVFGGFGRGFLVWVHAATGLSVVVLNAAFVAAWFTSQGVPPEELLFVRPVLAWTSVLLATGMFLMGVSGVSLYANLRPDSVVPAWRFDYALSRKIHRGVFVFVVALLGYHVFFTGRVSAVWTRWVVDAEFFGVLVLVLVVVWGVLAGQSCLMVFEWLTGDMFSGMEGDLSVWVSVVGGTASLVLVFASAFLGLSPVGVLLVVALFLFVVVGWRLRRG